MHHDSAPILRNFNAALDGRHFSAALSVGFDIVQISRIGESLERFGEAFTRRLFTDREITDVTEPQGLNRPSLAARFAAKEAVIKALGLSEAGVGWRDMEVIRQPDGRCVLQLHGVAASKASSMGLSLWQLSLSHEGDYAGAVVFGCASGAAPGPRPPEPLKTSRQPSDSVRQASQSTSIKPSKEDISCQQTS